MLHCNSIGIHDGFFARGGDSLRAIQCINLLKERYQIELSMQSLLSIPRFACLPGSSTRVLQQQNSLKQIMTREPFD
ncbi:phosphopantetheine-binding protein [Brevibacillus laterosporus]